MSLDLPGQLAPGPDERLLHGVMGEVGVAQDEAGDRVEPVDLARGKLPERLSIPVLRSLDEVLSHRRRRHSAPAIWPVLTL